MRRRMVLAPVAVAAAAAFLAAAGAAPAATRSPTVAISGSSTALPVVADLAYFYRRSHPRAPRFVLTGGGTDSGIVDAARGIADIGLASRERAPDDPPGLVGTAFAYSAICLATNRANRLTGMSHALLQDLVTGRVTSWAQVPGSGRADPIVAIGVLPGRGAARVFAETLLDPGTVSAARTRSVRTAAQVRRLVLATPGAWGYVDLLYTRGLRVLAYDGVPCTRSTVVAGRYPAVRPLAFVTRGTPRGAARRFIRWVRTSRVARRIIATRYVPVRD